jgi:hypothetical protein
MAQDQGLPEITFDTAAMYREESYTDRKAGTIRVMVPVTATGAADSTRATLYAGQTQLLTPGGVLPLVFEIDATSLEEAIRKFPDSVKLALEQAIDEAREMRREQAGRIVVPEVGAGVPSGGPGRIIR